MQNPGDDHWKAMGRLVGYIASKHYDGIIYRKPKSLKPVTLVDSEYGANTDHRKSVSSGLSTVGGTLVSFESRTQRCQTLSSTEAEYHSLATGACENKFIMMLMDEIFRRPSEKREPGIIFEDNQGVIYLIVNQHVSARTKHIDVRVHWARTLQREGWFNVLFIRSAENSSDILNKNASVKIHQEHAKKLRTGTLDCWREDVSGTDAIVDLGARKVRIQQPKDDVRRPDDATKETDVDHEWQLVAPSRKSNKLKDAEMVGKQNIYKEPTFKKRVSWKEDVNG